VQGEVNPSWLFSVLKPIAEHPLLPVAGFATTALAVVLAYVFYRRSLREKKPRYAVFSQTLVHDLTAKLPALRIMYDGIPQECVTVTTIFFWNDGREAIRRADIADTDPLRIVTPSGTDLLSARIQDVSNKACNVLLARPENSPSVAELSFAFLDHNDGFTVNLVHNGTEKDYVKIDGTLIGGKIERLKLDWENRPVGPAWNLLLVSSIIFSFLAITTIANWAYPGWRLSNEASSRHDIDAYVYSFVILGMLLIWLGEKLIVKIMPRVPQRLWIFW